MSVLEDSTFIKILKETTTFLTHIGDLSLRVFCYTPFGVLRYENP
jgi:hypothetical protein